jgi:hypothetical protein
MLRFSLLADPYPERADLAGIFPPARQHDNTLQGSEFDLHEKNIRLQADLCPFLPDRP